MGVSAYFCKSLSTDSRSLARLKATMVVGVAAAQQSDEEARVNEDVSGHTRSPSDSASFERSDRPAGCRRNRSNRQWRQGVWTDRAVRVERRLASAHERCPISTARVRAIPPRSRRRAARAVVRSESSPDQCITGRQVCKTRPPAIANLPLATHRRVVPRAVSATGTREPRLASRATPMP